MTKPSYAVAQNAYQVLLELHRAHPDDAELGPALLDAKMLMDTLWCEERQRRAALL